MSAELDPSNYRDLQSIYQAIQSEKITDDTYTKVQTAISFLHNPEYQDKPERFRLEGHLATLKERISGEISPLLASQANSSNEAALKNLKGILDEQQLRPIESHPAQSKHSLQRQRLNEFRNIVTNRQTPLLRQYPLIKNAMEYCLQSHVDMNQVVYHKQHFTLALRLACMAWLQGGKTEYLKQLDKYVKESTNLSQEDKKVLSAQIWLNAYIHNKQEDLLTVSMDLEKAFEAALKNPDIKDIVENPERLAPIKDAAIALDIKHRSSKNSELLASCIEMSTGALTPLTKSSLIREITGNLAVGSIKQDIREGNITSKTLQTIDEALYLIQSNPDDKNYRNQVKESLSPLNKRPKHFGDKLFLVLSAVFNGISSAFQEGILSSKHFISTEAKVLQKIGDLARVELMEKKILQLENGTGTSKPSTLAEIIAHLTSNEDEKRVLFTSIPLLRRVESLFPKDQISKYLRNLQQTIVHQESLSNVEKSKILQYLYTQELSSSLSQFDKINNREQDVFSQILFKADFNKLGKKNQEKILRSLDYLHQLVQERRDLIPIWKSAKEQLKQDHPYGVPKDTLKNIIQRILNENQNLSQEAGTFFTSIVQQPNGTLFPLDTAVFCELYEPDIEDLLDEVVEECDGKTHHTFTPLLSSEESYISSQVHKEINFYKEKL